MGSSVLHIKTEVECRVYLFDEEKGIAKPGIYFNLEVRKGEQDLLFVSMEDESVRCKLLYNVEENESDYRVTIEQTQFVHYTSKIFRLLHEAEQGNADAQFNLGVCYYHGKGVEQDHVVAVKWFRKSAEQGYARAQCILGACYDIGSGVVQDWEEAVKWYRKAADQGNVDAQNMLGDSYYGGLGIEQDDVEAVKWFHKAAEQGYAKAQNNLGECYKNGRGVGQDYVESVMWFRKAAEQGYAKAQNNLGECYKKGRGVGQDYVESVMWFRKAAEQGNAFAQNNLGVCYGNGKGVEQDWEEAVKWFRKAAENDYARAQYILGVCYGNGKGVEQDWKEAVKWFRKAADQGNADAQNYLGGCYYYGRGVEQDDAEAVKWFRKAADQGNVKARNNLELLEWKRQKNTIDSTSVIPYYLFFDTETTGIPRNYNAPASNTRNWPRLVQLGWIVTDEEGNVLSQGNEIVKPDGFVIPEDAARVHGITTERAQREGKPLREVIEAFLKDAQQTKCIVGHNISFDQKVVGAELYRLGIPDTISTAKSLCTMQACTDYCKIPEYYGYKWPKLQELHYKLFGCDFEGAHDAMVDITATKKCFFEMRKRGLI